MLHAPGHCYTPPGHCYTLPGHCYTLSFAALAIATRPLHPILGIAVVCLLGYFHSFWVAGLAAGLVVLSHLGPRSATLDFEQKRLTWHYAKGYPFPRKPPSDLSRFTRIYVELGAHGRRTLHLSGPRGEYLFLAERKAPLRHETAHIHPIEALKNEIAAGLNITAARSPGVPRKPTP